jgi:hypothetical protein
LSDIPPLGSKAVNFIFEQSPTFGITYFLKASEKCLTVTQAIKNLSNDIPLGALGSPLGGATKYACHYQFRFIGHAEDSFDCSPNRFSNLLTRSGGKGNPKLDRACESSFRSMVPD